MKSATAEKLKIALIILLAVSGIFLAILTGLTQWRTPTVYTYKDDKSTDTYLGVSAVVFYNGQKRIGAAYHKEVLDSAYKAVRPLASEAAGLASGPVKVNSSAWREALAGKNIYITFFGELPLAVLWDALGAGDCGTDMNVTGLIIAATSDTDHIRILAGNTESGEYISYETEMKSILFDELDLSETNTIRLAAELGFPFSALPADTLLSEETGIPSMKVSDVLSLEPNETSSLSTLLSTFDINPYTAKSYTSAHGERVYVSDAGTLYVSQDGSVHYQAQDDQGISAGVENTDGKAPRVAAVLCAAAILEDACGQETGEAGYFVSGVSYDKESRSFTVLFGRSVGGIRIISGKRLNIAAVQVRGGKILSAEFIVNRYEKSDDAGDVLSGRQAFAAFCSESKKATSLELFYSENKSEAIPVWYERALPANTEGQ